MLPRRDAPMIDTRLSCTLCALAVCSLLTLAGCGSKEPSDSKAGATPATTPATTASLPKNADPAPAIPGLKTFREAVLQDVPEGEQRPPDTTVTGKSLGKLYERIAGREGAP